MGPPRGRRPAGAGCPSSLAARGARGPGRLPAGDESSPARRRSWPRPSSLGWLFQLALARPRARRASTRTLMDRALSRTASSYLTVAASDAARDPAAFLDHHAERRRRRCRWARSTPPPIRRARSCSTAASSASSRPRPRAAAALLTAAGIDPDGRTPSGVRARRRAGRPAAHHASCARPPRGRWPRSPAPAALDAPRAARVAALWPLLPGPALMTPHFDQMLALPGDRGRRPARRRVRRRPGGRRRACLAGLCAGIALQISYGAAALRRASRSRPRSRSPAARSRGRGARVAVARAAAAAARRPRCPMAWGHEPDRRRAHRPRHPSRGLHRAALVRDVAAVQPPRPRAVRRRARGRRSASCAWPAHRATGPSTGCAPTLAAGIALLLLSGDGARRARAASRSRSCPRCCWPRSAPTATPPATRGPTRGRDRAGRRPARRAHHRHRRALVGRVTATRTFPISSAARVLPERRRRARLPGDVAAHPRPAQRRRHLLDRGDRGRLHARARARAATWAAWPARGSRPRAALRAFALIELGIAAFGALSVALYYDWLYVHAARLYEPLWRAALLHVLGPRRADVPDGHVAAVPGPRDGAQRAARRAQTVGRLYAVNLLGAAVGRGAHPVGAHPPLRHAGRRAVARRRPTWPRRLIVLAARGRRPTRRRTTRPAAAPATGARIRYPLAAWAAPLRASAASARCPWRCCGSASPTSR